MSSQQWPQQITIILLSVLGSKGRWSQSGKEVRRSSAKVRCHGIRSQMMEHVCLKSLADAEGEMPDAASIKSKSFLSWNLKQTDVDRQTTSSFQGEETQTLEEAIFLTAGHSDKAVSWWDREPDYQHLPGNLIFLIFSYIHHYSRITLLLSLAFELLISLFVKMTLAGSICSVPYPSEWKSVIPHSAHLAAVRGISLWLLWQLYFSIFMTSLISQVY